MAAAGMRESFRSNIAAWLYGFGKQSAVAGVEICEKMNSTPILSNSCLYERSEIWNLT